MIFKNAKYLKDDYSDKLVGINVTIDEIDVSPVQIQGPKSLALMKDLVGGQVDLEILPFYGLKPIFGCIRSF